MSLSNLPGAFMVGILGVSVLIAVVLKVFRRRFLHPLRTFPGPWLNSVTDLPGAYKLAIGNQHAYYKRLHDEYGPVVRVAPDELSFIGADAWEDIYGNRKNGPSMEKSPIFIGAVSPMKGQTGISLAPADVHARQRRAMAYPLSNSALLQQQYILKVHIEKLVTVVKKMVAENKAVNWSNWYTYTTFDMMGDLTFAEPFGCLDQGGATDWSTSVINVFMSAAWDQSLRRVTGVGTLATKLLVKLLIPKKAATWRKVHFQNSREKTLARLADPDRDHKDIIYHILQNADSKKALSENEIIMNMVLLISAGTETTASLLTGWTYFICTNPKVYRTLTAEIRSAFKSQADISWETTKELSYLNATIFEALRIFSPAPANQQRVVPIGGATIDGHFVPAGYTVSVAAWAATHTTLNFKDPTEFKPERWLGDPQYAGDNLHASQAFSLGPRGCIGKNLSFFEMRLIMSYLLWNFDMTLAEGKEYASNKLWDVKGDMKHIKVYQTWVKPDLWVKMKEVSH